VRYDIARGVGLALLALTAGAGGETPALRRLNYIALEPAADAAHEITVACKSHGSQYQDIVRCRLIETDGDVKFEGRANPGSRSRVSVPKGRGHRLALEINSGWNAAIADIPSDLPWACSARVGQPMRTVGEWGPLYFFVPTGTRKVALWIDADVTREAAHLVVRDPDGRVVLDREDDFDARTKIELSVAPPQAGKPWSVSLVGCSRRGWHTDDVAFELGDNVPGLLAPRAEWSVKFGEKWRKPDSARAGRTRLAPIAPTRAPYRPPDAGALAKHFERKGGEHWRTSLPFTYILDYGPQHVGNEAYVPSVATAPPTLLHLGKDVPFNHAWGPVRGFGGENQAYGFGDAIERLAPSEVVARIESLRGMVDQLHRAGVRYVTPYICGMTLNGDPEKRSGFWGFYDHWDEYTGLGLGPRPEEDPLKWLQTTADGKPFFYYKYDNDAGFYPAFKTNHRFAACWRTQGWRDWLLDVVRFVAQTGCDGVFVDNGCSQRSKSPAALGAFRAHLKSNLTAAQAQDLLGIPDRESAVFPDERKPGPASAELRRFWCSTLHDQMAALKDAGSKALGREFIVFPNGGHPADLQAGLRDTDFVMFEKSIGTHGTNPGLVLQTVLDGVTLRSINDNLFEYLFVRSLRARVRPVMLTRPGYPGTIPHLVMNADAARLGMAECAAFSGGGGFLVQPRFDVYHDALNEYREFIETHPHLYADLLPLADTAILAFPEQGWLGNAAHIGVVQRLTPELADAHVLFEFISESRLDAQPLDAKIVTACGISFLSDRHLQALAGFVEQGGTLLVSGPFAEQDEYLRPRAVLQNPLAALRGLEGGQIVQAGKGRLVRADGEDSVVEFLGRSGVRVRTGDGKSAPGLRLAAYRSSNGQKLIVHAVNYNVPLGVNPPAIEEVRDVDIELPLPAGRGISGFDFFSPDQPSPIEGGVRGENGIARIHLDRIRIYGVAELRLEARR